MAKGQASRVFVWIILGLLFIGLAGFGATSFGGGVRAVAKAGDEEIDVGTYGRELQQELRALSQDTGRAVSLAEAQTFGIDRAVLARLIGRAALDNEARQLGLSVGDEAVAEQVADLPAFQGLDGSFDREAYAFAIENAGLSVAQFENRVRDDTARNILQAAVTGGIGAPEAYIEALYRYARETRDITWARLGPENLTEPLPEPSEEDLENFHAENEQLFTLPETRVITYAWVTPDMLLDAVDADEDELRAAYEARIDDYVRPERRLVERLVFGTEDEARAALERIEAGTARFEDLVEERGLTLSDIDMGDVTAEALGAAGEGVFALDGPGIAGPLPSSLGPALFRVNAILSATETSFDEAREELAAEVASDAARRAIVAMIGEMDDLLAGGATLEDLAAETDMALGTIDFRAGVEDGIAAYQEFRDAAILVSEDDFPEVLEFDEGGLFAIRLDEIRPPALQPLDEVRPEVIAAWETAETARLLTERAQEAAQAIEAGAEMAGQDLPLRVARGLTRDGFVDDAPPQMVENVFQMQEGDVRVFRAADGAAIVRLDAIAAANPYAPEARALIASVGNQSAQAIAGDALQMFTNSVQLDAGIEVNQAAINAVHAQFP